MTRDFGPVTATLDLWPGEVNFAITLTSPGKDSISAVYQGPQFGFDHWPENGPPRDLTRHATTESIGEWMRAAGCTDADVGALHYLVLERWTRRRHDLAQMVAEGVAEAEGIA